MHCKGRTIRKVTGGLGGGGEYQKKICSGQNSRKIFMQLTGRQSVYYSYLGKKKILQRVSHEKNNSCTRDGQKNKSCKLITSHPTHHFSNGPSLTPNTSESLAASLLGNINPWLLTLVHMPRVLRQYKGQRMHLQTRYSHPVDRLWSWVASPGPWLPQLLSLML